MVSLEELRHERRAAIVDLARRHGARDIRVYGSVARGQANDSSDLELLVEWEADRSLKQDFADLLGVNVDIGSERGLHWFVRDEVVRRVPVESAIWYLHLAAAFVSQLAGSVTIHMTSISTGRRRLDPGIRITTFHCHSGSARTPPKSWRLRGRRAR